MKLDVTGPVDEVLREHAPATVQVLITPVWTDRTGEGRMRHVVCLLDDRGHTLGSRTAAREVFAVLRAEFPGADWSKPHTYFVATGAMLSAVQTPTPLGVHEGGARP